GLPVDFGDEAQRRIDGEALAHPVGGAGEATRAEGNRLQVLDEAVVGGRSEADGGQAELRRRSFDSRGGRGGDHVTQGPTDRARKDIWAGQRKPACRPITVVGSPESPSPSWTPPDV